MVQTIQVPPAGGARISRGEGDGTIAMAGGTFEAVTGRRIPVPEVLAAELPDPASARDSVVVGFGVGVIANAGAAIAMVSSEACLKSTQSRKVGLNLDRRMHPEFH